MQNFPRYHDFSPSGRWYGSSGRESLMAFRIKL
ncbi:hypothetical protein V6Z11_D04G037500 [Gossypium hirsutum]